MPSTLLTAVLWVIFGRPLKVKHGLTSLQSKDSSTFQ